MVTSQGGSGSGFINVRYFDAIRKSLIIEDAAQFWLNRCGTVPLVTGRHTSYPALEIWLYEEGYRPLLLYYYNPQTYERGLFDILLRTTF